MQPAEYIRIDTLTGEVERKPFLLSDYLRTQRIPTGGFSQAELDEPVMEMPQDAAASLIKHWNDTDNNGYTYSMGDGDNGSD